MSFWKEPVYGPKRQELNWLNGCITMHDNFCGCNTPADHLINLLATKSGYQVVKNTKCPTGIKDTETTGKEEDIGLDDGELERLFAEEDEEDNSG